MERLTKRSEDTSSTMVWFVDKEKWGMRYEPCEMDSHQIREVLCKLAEYEDAEEDGLLIKVECRCKDCVHVDYAGCSNTTCYCMKNSCFMQEDDFCKYAEKSKDEGE